MTLKGAEYNSLRQELLDHQNRRGTILNLALTASAALFAAGLQVQNPLIPLSALPLLYLARMQIVQTHSAIQRIATYICIVLEQDDPDLNWETASYEIRHDSIATEGKGIRNISPLRPIDLFLFTCSLIAIVLALVILLVLLFRPVSSVSSQSAPAWPMQVYFAVTGIATLVWALAWLLFESRVRELEKMTIDKREAEYWEAFKAHVSEIKANQRSQRGDAHPSNRRRSAK